ncbi:VOC family protein [Bosea sp. AS-1]|jgi:catechol 2,3-dioxygenase-like lactoylglutathione lyase family enzyme|uniref:VOC family protein n=1 Tax=Bosea sp. AS-1 TaxID=2015316 RepID=UPI000B7780F3|nr:VOC family protein [Bosea sp. AS-1]
MFDAHFILLHVESPAASARFYADLLGQEPLEQSPTFAMFALPSGARLGLWSRHTVEPAATAQGGAAEIATIAPSAQAVDATCADWSGRGIMILQPPTDLDFGRTFTACDPDGHRLRVFWPFPEEK